MHRVAHVTRDGFGKAYQHGFSVTLNFLRSRGAPPESAREASQAAWAKGWERLGQLRDEELLVAWVNTIALNIYRRLRRREDAGHSIPDFTVTPGVNLAAIDIRRILRVCRPADRTLLEHQLHGLTPREIARLRGVPESAIRVRLLRARRSARLRIQRVGR